MKIAVDIDDVIVDTSASMRDFITQYDKTGEVSKYLVEIMRGEIPTPNIREFLNSHMLEIIKNAKVKENAREVIAELRENGNKIFLVTSRGEKRYKGSKNFTLKYLKENGIQYDEIFFDIVEKAKECKRNGIEILVDDSVKYCEECIKIGLKGIIFTSEVNKSIKTSIDRVNNWLELQQFVLK